MADEPIEDEAAPEGAGADGAEGEGEAPKKRRLVLNRKTVLMLGVPALLLFLGGGYFAVEASGFIGGSEPAEAIKKQALYFDLPEMVVNLSSPENRVQYLKIKVALEAGDQATLNALNPVMPRILDAFQIYLRELRTSDLEGSAGIFRLKEELLRRINVEVHPHEVNRVLFKEIIVQ
jgi:flagellar protein FliL